MQLSVATMQAAVRVLAAINDHRNPSKDDIKALEVFAGTKPDGVDFGEFALAAIKKGIAAPEVDTRRRGVPI